MWIDLIYVHSQNDAIYIYIKPYILDYRTIISKQYDMLYISVYFVAKMSQWNINCVLSIALYLLELAPIKKTRFIHAM